MLLVKLTYSGTDYYLSQDGHALTHLWKQYVLSFDPPQRRLPLDYGGYCKLEWGSIKIAGMFFQTGNLGVWPPPAEMDITIYHTDTDEASAVTLLSGVAHRVAVDLQGVTYDIYGPEYADTVAASTAYNDTLVTIAMAMCATLGLSLDSTAARSPSPAVVHTTSHERLLIDLLSDFCAFYSHLFYIEGTTLYLVDMLADNGSRTIEFKYLRGPEYHWEPLTYEVTDGTNVSFGTNKYGRSVRQDAYHDTAGNITAAFDDILTVCNSDWASISIPFEGDVPVPGEKISWTDEQLAADTEMYIRARSITYDFDRRLIHIEGEGSMTKSA